MGAALVGAQQLFDAAVTVFEIHEGSLVKATTPGRLLGRVSASLRFVSWCAMLVGMLAGGLLGDVIGPRETMLIGALGALPAALWLARSQMRWLREPAVNA